MAKKSVLHRSKRPAAPAKKAAPPKKDDLHAQKRQLFPIVGIGASAGGLEALTTFLKHLPSNSGMVFVLIQHLDPKHPSQLTEILSKVTKMPIMEVGADVKVRADHVYVLAPGTCLRMSDGTLCVDERGKNRNLPIDYFMQSLARDNTSKAIGIVLSGTASDGTLGLKAVKAEGGITFAQDPASAKFDGMPRSAIAAGVVDFVLPPEEIARRLVRLAQHPYVVRKSDEDNEVARELDSSLTRIFQLLRSVTGNDFTHYKHTTLRRRIQRRMVVHANEKLTDYVAYLQENPAEVRALADDLLICVTSFFREPEYFEALAQTVFPEILKNKSSEDAIRVWVAGCATGEEAYSLAICLAEFLETSGANLPVQIFATDISESAIERARAGIYEPQALAEVSPARLKRFFVKVGDRYQIVRSIRESCIFARQNVAKDPPFHRLDLITCCNMLIYFGPVLQRKVLATFHYSLNPRGFLMLGPSESVSPLSNAFTPLDKKLKIYAKRPDVGLLNFELSDGEPFSAKAAGKGTAGEGAGGVALDVQKTAERMLLAEYAPPGVIVDDAMNIVQVRGNTGPYLQLPSGEPTYNLLKMAREGLVVSLRGAFLSAKRKKSAVSQHARVKHNGGFKDVNTKVIPIDGTGRGNGLHFMVLFEDIVPPRTEISGKIAGAKPATDQRRGREDARLRQELSATREYLQSIIEEQEASTEELKSANEEAQASNEELETSKEELQSTNEELNTLNDELKTRNLTLAELNADLANVMTSINVPLVMVGRDLKIRRFTPSMGPILNLIDSDMGRSISDLKPNIDVHDLPELFHAAIGGQDLVARDIQGPKDGGWYSLQVLPYRTPDGKINGALLLLLDIDAAKRARDYTEAVLKMAPVSLLVLTKDLGIHSANQAFYETFKVLKEETENRFIYDLGNRQWDIPKLREALETVLPEKREFFNFEVTHRFENIGNKTMLLSARELQQVPPFEQPYILLAIADITSQRQWEAEINRTNEDLRHFAYAASHDLQEPLRMVTTYAQLLSREYKGKLGENANQYIAYMVEGTQRMDALLKGMREYWQAGERGEQRQTGVDSNAALEKAVFILQDPITKTGAAVTHDLLPVVWADEAGMIEIFQNLIGNAIKYRSEEPPRIHVSAAGNAKGEWVFSVKDNGMGIDPKFAKKIFDIFSRLNGQKYPGSGIGLALCRKVVERFGGRIWVESQPGQGADFKFAVPSKE